MRSCFLSPPHTHKNTLDNQQPAMTAGDSAGERWPAVHYLTSWHVLPACIEDGSLRSALLACLTSYPGTSGCAVRAWPRTPILHTHLLCTRNSQPCLSLSLFWFLQASAGADHYLTSWPRQLFPPAFSEVLHPFFSAVMPACLRSVLPSPDCTACPCPCRRALVSGPLFDQLAAAAVPAGLQ